MHILYCKFCGSLLAAAILQRLALKKVRKMVCLEAMVSLTWSFSFVFNDKNVSTSDVFIQMKSFVGSVHAYIVSSRYC